MKYYFTFVFFIIINSISLCLPESYSLEKKKIKPQYSALSCKIDSFYFALQYFDDNPKPIKFFISMIPVQNDKYLKINKDGTYSIYNPYFKAVGDIINSQQAKFSFYKKLYMFSEKKIQPVCYDKEGFIDSKKLMELYGRSIGFGIDNLLLLNKLIPYLDEKGITCKLLKTENPILENMVDIFIKELLNNRIIICNGIVDGFKNPRVFTFTIINSSEVYRWKEASHSYAIIGYDLKRKYFIAADNYGSLNRPYSLCYRNISFSQVYKEITMLDKFTFDKSFSIGKK